MAKRGKKYLGARANVDPEEAQRRDLLIDKKTALDRSFLAVRFDGLEPVLPPAASSGQRLTNYLSELTLQALYHPNPSFDDLRVRFRAVSTDLVSGRRVVMEEGSLAEALRASSTVPLLFSPIERDSKRLVDGGLVTNIPADIAATEGCDLILVVNSTSGHAEPGRAGRTLADGGPDHGDHDAAVERATDGPRPRHG